MTKILWQIEDIIAATSGICDHLYDAQREHYVRGVSIDTRTLEPGDLFIAIVGDVHDGHKFVAQAFEKGAACALVSESFQFEGDALGPLVRVPDTLKAMEALGIKARERVEAQVIAVTGSVGKTGTKEALRLGLSRQGQTHASEKSYNNHWGVPLTLTRMAEDTEFGVFEIGMNHPGEITVLTKFVRPHITIITTVEPVHLGFFNSVEEIAEAKAEIFHGLEPGGFAILNADNPYFDLLKKRAEQYGGKVIAFGQAEDADSRLIDVGLHPDHIEVSASVLGQNIEFTVGAPGRHLAMNLLAVLTAIKLAGGDIDVAAQAFVGLTAQKGRGERHILQTETGQICVVDESYNANPASMRAALAAFSQLSREDFPRRIAVLGDMLELGEASESLHQDLKEPITEAGVDLVFACGPNMQALFDSLPDMLKGGYAKTSKELEEIMLNTVASGDAVMIKGSLGSAMGPLVEVLKEYKNAAN